MSQPNFSRPGAIDLSSLRQPPARPAGPGGPGLVALARAAPVLVARPDPAA